MTQSPRIYIKTSLLSFLLGVWFAFSAVIVPGGLIVKSESNQIITTPYEPMNPIYKVQIISPIIIEPAPVQPLSEEDIINGYIEDICFQYNIDATIVKSIVYYESRYNPNVSNGNCVGLMQVSTYWHASRAEKLGVTNFYDARSNILVGVDYLSELFAQYKDPLLVLMLYNMNWNDAFAMYKEGRVNNYARLVLQRAKELKQGAD